MEVQSQFIEMFGNCLQVEKLSSLCDTFLDGDWIESKDQSDEGIRLVQTGNVGNGIFKNKEEKCRFISDKTFDRLHCTEIFSGDILVSRLPDPIGRACMIPNGLGRMITAVDCSIIRLKESILPDFFIAYTMTPTYRAQINEVTTGTTRRRVSRANLGNVKVPVPPMEQQQQFVSIAHQADKSKFVGFKSQFIEMFGSVDDNPKSYDIKKVGDFAECFAGATPSTKISSYWDNGNIPWMSSGEVHKARVQDTDAKITQQGYDGCSTKMVPIHSIVIALAGQGKTRGTVAINDIELCTNQSLCAIVPNEEVNYEYLFHNLRGRYKELRSMSGDVDGRGGLNLKHIQNIKVIVPPMSEQMKFVSIARQADKSGFELRKSIDAIDAVIKSLINS